MKINLISFLLVLLCVKYTRAQKAINPYTAKIDSIQLLLDKQSAADTLRVIRLNNLAQVCLMDLQFKRGLMATKEARTLAKKLNFPRGEGLYFTTMRELNSDYFLWFYYKYKVIWFYVDRHESVPELSLNLVVPKNTDAEKSNKELMTALAYFEQKPDAEIAANILYLISFNYRILKKADLSMTYMEMSFKKFLEAKQPMTAYYVLAYKSYYLEKNGQSREAKLVDQQVNKFIVTHPDNREIALIHVGVTNFYYAKKDLPMAFASNSKANLLLERLGEQQLRQITLELLGNTYAYSLNVQNKALDYYLQEKTIAEAINDKANLPWIYHKVAFAMTKLKRFGEAIQYVEKAKKIVDTSPDSEQNKKDLAQHYDALGQILMGKQKYQEAISDFNQAIKVDSSLGDNSAAFYFNMYIAQCYQKMGNIKESIKYGLRSYEKASDGTSGDGPFVTQKVSQLLFENYDSLNNPSEAYKYLKINYQFQKETEKQNAANRLAEMEIQSLVLKSDQEKNRLEQARLVREKENQNQRWWLFSAAAGLFSAVVLLVIVYRNNRHKQKANALLHKQKEEIDRQRTKAESALSELKVTQAQLIQKEKLASLGELTAGIAHEIQNPLNFVNNFSQVSVELVTELEDEQQKLDRDPELEAELLGDLKQNLQKITHHGSRASSIVKGMLEHSRTGTGERQPTDLNALSDEYLRLAYHGLRRSGDPGKDQTFNSDIKTDFDPKLGFVEIVPQEIGRVLLNLYNNAFYAVKERGAQGKGQWFEPTIWVSTKQLDKQVEIRVRDNGTGIPESIKAKIFQPFFTTKPTGEGTGLGLSLSYDIITKGHGGALNVTSTEGQGTEFIITLPVTA